MNNLEHQPQNSSIKTMQQLMVHLKMSYEEYQSALQSSIKTETVFLKRLVDERSINGYNPLCLSTWKANMDIQYVVNPHACACYILDYVTKGDRGLSETIRVASKEAAMKNMSVKESIKFVSDKFINLVDSIIRRRGTKMVIYD